MRLINTRLSHEYNTTHGIFARQQREAEYNCEPEGKEWDEELPSKIEPWKLGKCGRSNDLPTAYDLGYV